MSLNYTYLLVNLGAVIVPFLFSFHPKLKFNKEWKRTIVALASVGSFFVFWDVYYTYLGVWGFNPKYLIGINLFNLPIEEVLFFVCIPYACLYTYHCLKILIKPFKLFNLKWVNVILISFLMVIGLFNISKLYTGVTFILLGLVLAYIAFLLKPKWLSRLYTSLLLLIIPFMVVNGVLTGTGIAEEVVWYNPNHFMGYRILTVPVEDFFYGFLLILLNVLVFEQIKSRQERV